ncbi:substrate-binding domain-containing protein [Paenibacillus sp. CAU 1782]
MSHEESYTASEIAGLLKISKLKVYELIKKGELPSYRVGKQMRVDASDLEAYKRQGKKGGPSAAASRESNAAASEGYRIRSTVTGEVPYNETPYGESISGGFPNRRLQLDKTSFQGSFDEQHFPDEHEGGRTKAPQRSFVLSGQDTSLDILARHLEHRLPGLRPLRSQSGSMDGLISLYKGESDAASVHLLDGDTGEYNLPYVRKLLTGFRYLVVNVMTRSSGLYVARNNPKGIKTWQDLMQPGLRLANRERGSGARVLLDEKARTLGILADQIVGYDSIFTNHLSVAAQVSLGEADVGIGTEKAASGIDGIRYIPLVQERYDLVMVKRPDNLPRIQAVLDILSSEAFKKELQALSGYDLSSTGTVWLES